MRNWYRIGEISALFQVPVETLRYYDKEGLIRPEKMEANGYRLYGSTQMERICTVLSLRAAGVPAADIRAMLETDSAEKALAMLDVQAEALALRLEELTRTRARLDQTREALRALTEHPEPVIRQLPALHLLAIPFRYGGEDGHLQEDESDVAGREKHGKGESGVLGRENHGEGELDIERTRGLREQVAPGWLKGASVYSSISAADMQKRKYHRYTHYGLMSEEPLPGDPSLRQVLPPGPYVVAHVQVRSLAHGEVDAIYDRMRAFAGSLGLSAEGPAYERTVFDLEPAEPGGHIHFFTLMMPVGPASGSSPLA